MNKSRASSVASEDDESSGVWDRLANTSASMERTARREEALRKELAQYSFQPVVNKSCEDGDASPRETSDSVHERLYLAQREIEQRTRGKREQRLAEELADCTFQPTVSSRLRMRASTALDASAFSNSSETSEHTGTEAWSRLWDESRDVAVRFSSVSPVTFFFPKRCVF